MNYSKPETVPATWEVGDVILEKYEVKQVFTSGGMGLVYRVYHREWDMDLAVKSPRREFFQSKQQIENFEREAETWVTLGLHPHIVSCYYVRRLGGIPRIFSEFIDGGTLADWIRTKKLYEGGGEKALQRILDVAIQFAWGLQFAHEKGLIHQDVKPGNVLVSTDGNAQISDFGLANARRESADSGTIAARAGQSILVPGAGFMTPEYASPEQLRGETLSFSTDIWSWAVSLLEMLTGELTWSSGLAAPAVVESLENALIDDALLDVLNICFGSNSQTRLDSFKIAIEFLVAYYTTRFGEHCRLMPKATGSLSSLNNRGVALMDLGKTAEASKAWRMACMADSSAVDPFNNLVLFKIRFGHDHRSLQQFRKWIDSCFSNLGDSEDAALAHTHILAELGEFKSAERCVARFIEKGNLSNAGKELLDTLKGIIASYDIPFQNHSISIERGAYVWVNPTWERVLKSSYEDDGERQFQLVDIQTGKVLSRISISSGSVLAAASRDVCSLVTMVRCGSDEEGKLVTLWHVTSGREVAHFKCSEEATSPVVTNGGRSILFSEEHMIRAAFLVDGRVVITDVTETQFPMRLKLFEDADLLFASGWNSNEPVDQNPETRLIVISSMKTLSSSPGQMTSPAVCSSKRWLVGVFGVDIYIYDLQTGAVLFHLSGHTREIRTMTVSQDESLLASASVDGTVRLWDLNQRSCRKVYEVANEESNSTSVEWVGISPDGLRLLAVTATGNISVWGIPTIAYHHCAPWRISRPLSSRQAAKIYSEFESLIDSADAHKAAGRYLECAQALSSSRSLSGRSRNSRAIDSWGSLYSKMKKGHLNAVWQTGSKKVGRYTDISDVFISDTLGYCCLATTTANRVELLNVPHLADIIQIFPCFGKAIHVTEVLDSDKIGMLWGDEDEYTGIFSATTIVIACSDDDKNISTVEFNESFTIAHFDKSGDHLLLGTETGHLKIFHIATKTFICNILAHDHPITSLAISSCGIYLATASSDFSGDTGSPAKVWNWKTGDFLGEIGMHSNYYPDALLFSPDSSMLIYNQDNLRLWSIPELELQREFCSSGRIVWSPFDSIQIVTDQDGKIVPCDLNTGEAIWTFAPKSRFSPDFRYSITIEILQGVSSIVCSFLDWDLGLPVTNIHEPS